MSSKHDHPDSNHPPAGRPTRQEFLARIKDSLRRSAPTPPPPTSSFHAASSHELARLVSHDQDLPCVFVKHASASGMRVERIPHDQLLPALLSLIRDSSEPSDSIAVSIADDALRTVCDSAVSDSGRSLCDWSTSPDLEPLYNATIGITDTHAAIAETGSIVVTSGPRRSRGGFLVPPVHIALVFAHSIRPDLIDLFPNTDSRLAAPLPTSLVLITGPSKTADIEGILITGVHGPKEVIVLLID